jgi:CTP:phosphocholine cytidylyltransferase-like protein
MNNLSESCNWKYSSKFIAIFWNLMVKTTESRFTLFYFKFSSKFRIYEINVVDDHKECNKSPNRDPND